MTRKVNFGSVAHDYAKWRNDLPDTLFTKLSNRGIEVNGSNIADLGAGTGVLTRGLSRQGANVIAIEPSKDLTDLGGKIDTKEGVSITYFNRTAENTALPGNRYDYVTVLRAWHWFDREKALQEVKRILKEDGTFLVMDSGFLPKQSLLIRNTLQVIKKHMPNQKMTSPGSKSDSTQLINSFPVEWFEEWKENSFELTDCFKFSYEVSFTPSEWKGRVGSLSWLSMFERSKRERVLQEVQDNVTETFGSTIHAVPHEFYVSILKKT
ncbi:class I SAM-dependent methyltransferase [Bacillus sp. FJAT-44742]|uniref:class I SAM-dependent methyltransferase n=1 Tax=Bacillus sp. FJAT-44742 TaxID=2014005 RepID=UPI000C23614B|nr:class I SAM-dependent methyltransferase [Bacillus sp. FJAT-44742]